MVESLEMFLFLFKSKYRRKFSWFSPFLCSIIIVLLFCQEALSKCNETNCVNGFCKNETCLCFEGWQGSECQHCGGKINLTSTTGIVTDGPGNYSVSTQCSWLISPPWLAPFHRPVIRVRLESFATECGWDHLYVYDGDSVQADKLLAVFSGVMDPTETGWTRQVIARSGNVLIHFFSDDAYAMEGFNITYAAYSCPSDDQRTNCSSHGTCHNGICTCDTNWIGVACDQFLCPDDCNSEYGYGECTSDGCLCKPSRSGADCTREIANAGWEWAWKEKGEGKPGQEPPEGTPQPAAGHVLLTYGDDLLRVGGETFSQADFLYRFKVADRLWYRVPTVGETPLPRYAHSAVLFGDELFVYGGVVAADEERGGGLTGLEGRANEVTNELWKVKLDIENPKWVNVTPTICSLLHPAPYKHCGGLHVSGHTAVVVRVGPTRRPVMLAFFGHSPHFGYLHIVQEYFIEEGIWGVASTKGWAARAGFGHSAAWDELSGKVYIHAGLVSESEATQAPSAALYEYEVETRIWKPLPYAPTPRYLHTAIFVSPGIMLVFGGNAHNDSAAAAVSNPTASRCFCPGAAIYDVRCQAWYSLSSPVNAARVAHSSALLPLRSRRTALIHGGFDGRLRSDALLFETGTGCSSHTTEEACLSSAHRAGVACAWKQTGLCVPLEEIGWKESFSGSVKACFREPELDERRCLVADSCSACLAAGCAWCGACYASHTYCHRHRHQFPEKLEDCNSLEDLSAACGRFHSCAACHHHRHHHAHGAEEQSSRLCFWDYDTIKCRPSNTTEDVRSAASSGPCSAPCSSLVTCANCTAEECIWCASASRCVDKNAYGASFPLGGCRAWSTSGGNSAACTADVEPGCGTHASCAACRAEPACGWCDDGFGGGRGTCLAGGGKGPHRRSKCPQDNWHFTTCPACQCNGHSICDRYSRCIQPCAGRAVGDHCEQCAPGHWGTPLNGGHCQPCECNERAVTCAPDTGKCYCSTKGLAGERCDKCDHTNHYHEDNLKTGNCFYDLAVDYQFTFNLSKKEDRHLSAINFRNAPVKPDVDADFSITCSSHARMNVTVRSRGDPKERTLFSEVNCTNFKYKFSKSEHAFGVEDNVTLTTFLVYVYDFRPPLWIQISFSQYPKLNLQQFFITFSSCFLLLLLVAAALWKIKQKYDLYRRRQRLFVEMEQMASRPFSQVCIELEKPGCGNGGVPAPVALEPCAGGRAAVLSLVVRLPTGGTGRAPPLGGLAVASALVTLGHHAYRHKPPPR